MPVSKGGKNKQKSWRKVAETVNQIMGKKHSGRAYKYASMREMPRTAAPDLLAGMLERAGIDMPKAVAFRDALNNMAMSDKQNGND